MKCTSRNNTGTVQRPFSSDVLDSSQLTSSTVHASDADGQPLSLAEQIERQDCALTADELSRTLNVSKITIFKQANPVFPHRDMCTVRPEGRRAMAQKHVERGFGEMPMLYDQRASIAFGLPDPKVNRNTLPSAGIGIGPSSVKPAMTKDRQIKFGCTTPRALPSNGTSRSKAKPTRTIQPMKPISKNGNKITCWKRFGVHALFAISGMNNVDSARCAIHKSPGSQAGPFITASPV